MTEPRLRDRAAGALVDHRRVVVVVTLAVVLATSAGVVFLEEESGLAGSFDFGSEEEAALSYVEANFSGEASDREVARLVVRSENVFEKETLLATLELQAQIRENESVAPTLADDRPTVGIANVVATAAIRLQEGNPDASLDEGPWPTLAEQRAALANMSQAEVDLVVRRVLDEEAGVPEAFDFLPRAYEPGTASANSTMVVVFQPVDEEYPVTAAPPHIVESHLTIEAVGAESDLETAVIGSGILTDEDQRAVGDSLALVGPAALVLVVLVLVVAYRDPLDVLLGLAGILLVLLWTFGALGWLGIAFNPALIAVPALLIGLSIDYCIHLFMRYREHRSESDHGREDEPGESDHGREDAPGESDHGREDAPGESDHGREDAPGESDHGREDAPGESDGTDTRDDPDGRSDRTASDGNGVPSVSAAMTAAVAGVGSALVWVTVTTAIGFLSNLASPVAAVRELGIVAAIGIVGAFVVFVVLMPPLKAALDARLERAGFDRIRRPFGTGDRAGRVLAVGSRAARRAPLVVLIAVLVVTGLATVAAVNVSTSWGPQENMVDDPPEWTERLPGEFQPGEYDARDRLVAANERYVSPNSEGELLVTGNVTDPGTLERVAAARERAGEQAAVTRLASGEPRVTSPLGTMERVAETDESFAAAFAAADTTGDGVPDENLTALYDALFETAPDRAEQVLHREDGEYRALRMTVTVDGGTEGGVVTDHLEAVGEELDSGGVTVTATGRPVLEHVMAQHLLETLLSSFVVTLVVVLAVLMAVFRVVHGSATLGAVTLVPVVFAVGWIVGTMTLLGYPLSVLNVVIASLTIGIGIDYSIHVSERFRDELATRPVGEALSRTVRGTGGALLGSAATTAIGFGVLALAVHPPLQQFGTLTAIMIGYAFVGAVFVLPSLLVLWARYARPAGRRVDERLRGREPANAD